MPLSFSLLRNLDLVIALLLALDRPSHRDGARLPDQDGLGQRETVRDDVAIWPFSPRVPVAILWLPDRDDVNASDDVTIALVLLFRRILQGIDLRFELLQALEIPGF